MFFILLYVWVFSFHLPVDNGFMFCFTPVQYDCGHVVFIYFETLPFICKATYVIDNWFTALSSEMEELKWQNGVQ